MNLIAEEMRAIMNNDTEYLEHYGTKFHSGRYPYGSGKDPHQHGGDFLSRVEVLRKSGWKETAENVEKEFGMKLEDYRNEKSWANYTRRQLNVSRAESLRDQGKTPTEIGKEMGVNESTVRGWLDPKSKSNMEVARNTAEFLKERIKEAAETHGDKGMLDVGVNVERDLNIPRDRLDKALYALESEGYKVYKNRIEQVTNRGNWTTQMVLCPPGTEYKEIYKPENIHSVKEYITRDDGKTFEKKFHYPASLDMKRVKVLTADEPNPIDGEPGIAKDGLIQIRRGVPDLSLGESKYAQVRILVGEDKYLKGMAVYADGNKMPDGIDVIFNSNKATADKALKTVKKVIGPDGKEIPDPENPFGSLIKDASQGGQYWYDAPDGTRKLSPINKRADEGDWDDWANAVPSQFLSKQNISLAKKQLNIAAEDKYAEFDAINSLTNPTIKKHFLQSFADDCDGAAVHLKAAALPGQKYNVIIPNNTLKDYEVYAPGYETGTKLALVRYPHGGTFEIPIVTVNNKNRLGKQILGNESVDAICVTKKVADRLSGADFDGDTVMCIPTHNGKVKITSTDELEGLKGFDHQLKYGTTKVGDDYYNAAGEKVKIMSKKLTQTQMGIITNLITDMTLLDATDSEKARAVRHSMVVIDAEKHKLDYKKSEIDNGISALVKKYQRSIDPKTGEIHTGGASTIISKAGSTKLVDKRRGNATIDPETGKQTWKPANADDLFYVDRTKDKKTGKYVLRTTDGKKIEYDPKDKDAVERYTPIRKFNDDGTVSYTNKAGDISYRVKTRTQNSTKMMETDDAYTLVSAAKHPMEMVYADYANKMKALANQARKEMVTTKDIKQSPSAKKVYAEEVSSLNTKLNDALKNSTRERQALRLATASVNAKKAANPDMDNSEIKKASQQALTKARQEAGSIARRDRNINITDREWEAIQAGAVPASTLKKILANTDADQLRQRAMPKASTTITKAQANRIKALSASNLTLAEIAKKLNISTSTVSEYLKGAN